MSSEANDFGDRIRKRRGPHISLRELAGEIVTKDKPDGIGVTTLHDYEVGNYRMPEEVFWAAQAAIARILRRRREEDARLRAEALEAD